MARQISRAEAWERAHEVFTQVNFNAFDYNTIKESLLDYTKLYFPEDFSDYIESDEFIALLELFAYVGELLAYRLDLNAHENFITTAERKESILRLAKLISYKASRNIPARGLVKVQSIQTTETVYDSLGRNLASRQILWNDANNPDWKEQFFLVVNRVLEQEFGSVAPNERVQVNDVLFELYTLNNNPLTTNGRTVLSYVATTGGDTFPMELTPVTLLSSGPEERRPEINGKFSWLYASDGLGDGSDTTGFLMLTKQGTLALQTARFDGVTPNQTYDIEVDNINETDLWVNNVDPDTLTILEEDPYEDVLPHLVSEDLRYGEWIEVDLANAQNILFNTNKNRHKYEVETLADDHVRLVFGDGEFSDIPSGTFHLWYRASANTDLPIPRSAVVSQPTSFTYTDATDSVQTITLTFSLVSSLQNSSESEDIEHIRRVAPSVYYTQDRMVNGRDYNTFMLQDPSILRLRAINRTFAGDSKYIAWHDPSEYYEDVKLFGDDLALYWNEEDPNGGGLTVVSRAATPEEVLENYLEPLLSSTDFFAVLAPKIEALGGNPTDLRRTFNTASDATYSFGIDPATGKDNEVDAIQEALTQATLTTPIVDLYYSVLYDEWTVKGVYGHPCDNPSPPSGCSGTTGAIWMIRVEAQFAGSDLSGWDVRWRTRRLLANSEETKFWNSNLADTVVNFDTLESRLDRIVLLAANINGNRTGVLTNNREYQVVAQELVEQNLPNAGLADIHRLSILPTDVTGDGVSDNLSQSEVFDAEYTGVWPDLTSSPIVEVAWPDSASGFVVGVDAQGTYIDLSGAGRMYNNSGTEKGQDADVEVTINELASPMTVRTPTFGSGELSAQSSDLVVDRIYFASSPTSAPSTGDTVTLSLIDYVYFTRDSSIDPWVPTSDTSTVRQLFLTEDTTVADEQRYQRWPGRYPLNFAWFHNTPRLHLVDPAASNIIDIFVITRSYYVALRRWLANQTDVEPTEPTPLDLRTSYADLLDNKMISDTVILHSGSFKILFGSRAIPQLRCIFKVIRPDSSSLTDNQVKVQMVSVIQDFFDIDSWAFGETFFFTELAASIHSALGPEIDSVVLVPTYAQNQFGDMFQVQAGENELFIPDISTSNIQIVQSFTSDNLRQNES